MPLKTTDESLAMEGEDVPGVPGVPGVPVGGTQAKFPTTPVVPFVSETPELCTSSASTSPTNSQIPLTSTSFQPSIDAENTVTLTSPSFTELLQTIDNIKITQFSPPRPEKPSVSYLLVEEMDLETFDRLWFDADLLKAVTTTLWREKRTALFRIMSYGQHEALNSKFQNMLNRNLLGMNLDPMRHDFQLLGSGRVYGEQTCKEPGASLYPGATSGPGITLSPSLVLEVGVSESYSKLVQDAQWWFANAPIRAGLVVLMHTTRTPCFRVDIEVWTDPQVDNRYDTGSSAQSRLQRSQHVYVQDEVVHGGPLRLDFELLMRRRPNVPKESDVVLTDQQVLYIAEQQE